VFSRSSCSLSIYFDHFLQQLSFCSRRLLTYINFKCKYPILLRAFIKVLKDSISRIPALSNSRISLVEEHGPEFGFSATTLISSCVKSSKHRREIRPGKRHVRKACALTRTLVLSGPYFSVV